MATNSQPQETPEYHTFREHYDRLVHAIQDPLPLATQLFSKGIITSAVKERMIVLGLTTLEKNNVLLSAVEKQIQSNPGTVHGFLSALNEDPSLRALVESVQGMCLICARILGAWCPLAQQKRAIRKSFLSENCTLQKQIGCFNHSVVTLVTYKLAGETVVMRDLLWRT